MSTLLRVFLLDFPFFSIKKHALFTKVPYFLLRIAFLPKITYILYYTHAHAKIIPNEKIYHRFPKKSPEGRRYRRPENERLSQNKQSTCHPERRKPQAVFVVEVLVREWAAGDDSSKNRGAIATTGSRSELWWLAITNVTSLWKAPTRTAKTHYVSRFRTQRGECTIPPQGQEKKTARSFKEEVAAT